MNEIIDMSFSYTPVTLFWSTICSWVLMIINFCLATSNLICGTFIVNLFLRSILFKGKTLRTQLDSPLRSQLIFLVVHFLFGIGVVSFITWRNTEAREQMTSFYSALKILYAPAKVAWTITWILLLSLIKDMILNLVKALISSDSTISVGHRKEAGIPVENLFEDYLDKKQCVLHRKPEY